MYIFIQEKLPTVTHCSIVVWSLFINRTFLSSKTVKLVVCVCVCVCALAWNLVFSVFKAIPLLVYLCYRIDTGELIVTVPKPNDVERNAERYLDHLQNQKKV